MCFRKFLSNDLDSTKEVAILADNSYLCDQLIFRLGLLFSFSFFFMEIYLK